MKKYVAVGTCIVALTLGGCGDSTQDRTLSGAGIGAAGGTVLGAVTGLTMAEGVLLGTAAGALTGALTDSSQINLGKPVWRKGAPATATDVKNVQANLASLGYNPGPIDGRAGGQTRAAVRQYQADHGMAVTGELSPDLAQDIYAKAQARQSANR
jgi:peptidoglycan hydrolase-like protein with peptidoglycan-binding domain